jgi:hypothetical protein
VHDEPFAADDLRTADDVDPEAGQGFERGQIDEPPRAAGASRSDSNAGKVRGICSSASSPVVKRSTRSLTEGRAASASNSAGDTTCTARWVT